ncbi:MAG TPA: hypothetical protein VFV17_00075 [Usitatibacteraceae bacterium]|nr:hypothetical protein [Usitatibacteraceae bacterium]
MPGYQVKHETIAVAETAFVIRSLLDNQQFADPGGLAAQAGISESNWPLFGLVWPAARILAETLHGESVDGGRTLEIGCGLALASLVIHRRGGDITASDRHPLAPGFLERNLALNDLPAMRYETGHWARDNPQLGRFDRIIGSDVLYERSQPQILAEFIGRHAMPAIEVLLVDPDRGNQGAFCKAMVARGFHCSVARSATHLSSGERFKGNTLRLRRGA